MGVSFQAHGREQDVWEPASLVDVLCRSVGVRLAEVHAVDAGVLIRDPAEGVAVT